MLEPIDFAALGGEFWQHTHQDLTVSGWWFEGADVGDSSQPKPVLHFLHGNGFCSATYWPLLQRLRDRFAICMTDLPGHGDSPVPEKFPPWTACIRTLISAIEHNQTTSWGDRPVFALAHSMGGIMTTVIASQRPNLFQAGLLLDPVWITKPLLGLMTVMAMTKQSHRLPHVKAALNRRNQWDDRQAVVESLRERGAYKGWESGALENFVAHNVNDAGQLRMPLTLEAHYFATPQTAGVWAAAKKIQIPMLAIYGDATYSFVGESLAQVARKNSHFTIQQVTGSHCFMLQDSAKAAAMVLEWFAEH